MNKQLLFIYALVRRGLNNEDLGSITKILFWIGIDNEAKFIEDVILKLDTDYFNKNNFIRNALNEHYNID